VLGIVHIFETNAACGVNDLFFLLHFLLFAVVFAVVQDEFFGILGIASPLVVLLLLMQQLAIVTKGTNPASIIRTGYHTQNLNACHPLLWCLVRKMARRSITTLLVLKIESAECWF
jgi:hypothetical protein